MNDQYFKEACRLIDNMTAEEMQTTAAECGIELIPGYSGKMLSEVPFYALYPTMGVLNPDGKEGSIHQFDPLSEYVRVNWNDGSWTEQAIHHYDKVKVK